MIKEGVFHNLTDDFRQQLIDALTPPGPVNNFEDMFD
jgi:hypothetical protein